MKRSLSLAAGIVLVAALALAATSTAGAGSPITVKAVCTVGPIRCQSALRTDIPIVKQAQAAHDGFGPADLRAAYNIKSLALQRGQGQTVAIVDAYDDPTIESDLATYRSYYGLPPCTTANGCFRKVNQDGEQGNYPIANPDWNAEEALDVEMVSAICPKCHIILVEANSADEAAVMSNPAQQSDLGQAADTAANLGANVISNSYGTVGPEPNQSFWDHYYNHPGIAVVASSGDYAYGTIWPAASPYVTAVGGTTLTKASSPRGWAETVWGSVGAGFPAGVQGTGSGCSLWEPKPAWQKDTGCTGRTVADVAAVADPGTGVAVFDSSVLTGGWGVYGGTSVASPIIGGFYALAGNAKKITYGSYPYSHTKFLYDVTEGSNFTPNTACGYLCTAGPGYDGPTGLGTPNGIGAF